MKEIKTSVPTMDELVALATGTNAITRDLKPGKYAIRLRDTETFGTACKVAPGVWVGTNKSGAYLALTVSVHTEGSDKPETIFFRYGEYEGRKYYRGWSKFKKGVCNTADIDFENDNAFYAYVLEHDIVAYYGYDEYLDENNKLCRKAGWNTDGNFTTVDYAPAVTADTTTETNDVDVPF